MAFIPSSKKYIEDYTNDDWRSTTYCTIITPTAVRGDFTGTNSIADMIPNYFHQEWYIPAEDKYLYNSPLMAEMFTASDPPTLKASSVPSCYVVAGVKKSKPQNISIFLMIPATTSDMYYTSSGRTLTTFYTPIHMASGTGSLDVGPLWTGNCHLNSDNNAWILQNGTNYYSLRNSTKYKTITFSSGCIYDIFEITSYSRDSAPSTDYRVLYQYPVNSTRKWNESAFTDTSHYGGTYYDARSYIKVAYACRSVSSKSWGTGTSIGTLPSLTYNIDDRKLGIKFWKTDYSVTGGGSYLSPSTSTIYDIEKSYSLVSYISEYNLPTAITTTAKCGNDTSQTSMYGSSNLATGTGEKYGSYKWSINAFYEQYILPGNALQGPLKFTVTYNITLPVWNKHTNSSGTVVYDDTSYTVVKDYTYTFKVDMKNVPTIYTAIGTRFRNHAAKYAVLANDSDYFEFSWRAKANYAVDPTVRLTLSFGDQVVVTKSMDGSSSTPQTFQHGPYLNVPTTAGQLVQITGIATDARGRASKVSTFAITDNNSQDTLEYLRFYPYNFPTVQVQGYRCLANGTPDDENGTYVKLTATYAFSSVDHGLTTYSEGTTDGNLTIKLIPHSGTLSKDTYSYNLTVANGSKTELMAIGLDQSVDIKVSVKDFIGNTYTASTEFVPSSQVVLDFRAGGEGLAIGKRNEFNKALEVAWDTTFYGNVNFRGNVNISGSTQAATSADAVSYNDSKKLGARTVQAALDVLANKAGVSTTQVQSIVNQAISNLSVPNDQHINDLIITKINNIVFPPSISEARALELIANELANFSAGIDETAVNILIDAKTEGMIKQDDLNPYIKRTEVVSGYYNKDEVDIKVAQAATTIEQVQELVDQAVAEMPTNEEAVRIANDALALAEEAQGDAGTAVVRSNQAKEKAEEAEDIANQATTTANSAKTIAEGIEGKADSAITTANGAKTTANEAKVIAERAEGKIDQAIEGLIPPASAIPFNDTVSLGADNVQSALVTLAGKPHLTQAQVNTLISNGLKEYRTYAQINSMINSALTNYRTETQINSLISTALKSYKTETQIQSMIEAKFNSIVNGNNTRY